MTQFSNASRIDTEARALAAIYRRLYLLGMKAEARAASEEQEKKKPLPASTQSGGGGQHHHDHPQPS